MSGTAGSSKAAESTRQAVERHLSAFALGVDAILADYTESSVLITPDAIYRGPKDLRGFFQTFLQNATPEFWAAFKMHARVIEGEIAYLVWAAQPMVPMATDTLLVRGGKILVQTLTPLKA